MPNHVIDGLYQLEIPTPFKVGPVNCYVTTTEPITLIDTGTKGEEARAALEAELAALGLQVSDLRRVIITHAHADHYAFYVQIMIEAGVPLEQRQRVVDGRRVGDPHAEAVKVDRVVDEGDEIKLADRAWRVYHTPGHAGGLICLFEPIARVLLSNDHLLRDISSNPVIEPDLDGGPRPHRLVQYIQHMQRMADLEPVIAWTGHGHPIHDVHKVVRQRIHFHERRAQRILDMIGAEERSAYQISEPLFGRLSGTESFLALSETIGHLDWLEEQGRIKASQQDEVIYWRTT
jgi:glyoxylase-like metal-dependent hydrolase (beta-lactamase superfamily II)